MGSWLHVSEPANVHLTLNRTGQSLRRWNLSWLGRRCYPKDVPTTQRRTIGAEKYRTLSPNKESLKYPWNIMKPLH